MLPTRQRGKRQASISAQAARIAISQRGGNAGNHCTIDMPTSKANAAATALGHVCAWGDSPCFVMPRS